MTDDQIAPGCRAQFRLNDGGPWLCVLPENHAEPHRDDDDDAWDLTYRAEPGVSQQAIPFVGPTTSLEARLTELEMAFLSLGENSCTGVFLAAPGETQGDYLHNRTHGDLIKELYQWVSKLYQRVSKLESGLGSTEISDLSRRVTGLEQTSATDDTSVDDQHRAEHECGPCC